MKSPIISANKGFLTVEAMVAVFVMSIMLPAAISLSWSSDSLSISAQKELIALQASSTLITEGIADLTSTQAAFYSSEWGKTSCDMKPTAQQNVFTGITIAPSNLSLGNGAIADASINVHNGFIYETVTASSGSHLYIIDARTPATPVLVSSFGSSPGLGESVIIGNHIYAANVSTASQLQIIDISDRTHPISTASLKLPLPTATSTAPKAHSIFFLNNLIYLGTEKWNGNEFNVINVSNPTSPYFVGGFNTDTLISNIYVNNGYAYVADSDSQQMRVLDVHDPTNITEANYFSPAGSDILEGKVVSVGSVSATSTPLYFGRDGGGFNNPNQYELFTFDLKNDPSARINLGSRDIPGGVYGIIPFENSVFLATRSSDSPLQIWTSDLAKEIFSSKSQPSITNLSAMTCDQDKLYIAVNAQNGFVIATPY